MILIETGFIFIAFFTNSRARVLVNT